MIFYEICYVVNYLPYMQIRSILTKIRLKIYSETICLFKQYFIVKNEKDWITGLKYISIFILS
jgi:hypothetical protein